MLSDVNVPFALDGVSFKVYPLNVFDLVVYSLPTSPVSFSLERISPSSSTYSTVTVPFCVTSPTVFTKPPLLNKPQFTNARSAVCLLPSLKIIIISSLSVL